MQTKLTLSVDPVIVQPIKEYARSQQTSLSQLVENYLKKLLTSSSINTRPISHPITQALSGSMKGQGKIDERKLKSKYLMEKYG